MSELLDILRQAIVPLEPEARNEGDFLRWYSQQASAQGLVGDPDDPLHFYDYREAYSQGQGPDETGHWPSKFKADNHPNRFIDGVDTKNERPNGLIDILRQGLEETGREIEGFFTPMQGEPTAVGVRSSMDASGTINVPKALGAAATFLPRMLLESARGVGRLAERDFETLVPLARAHNDLSKALQESVGTELADTTLTVADLMVGGVPGSASGTMGAGPVIRRGAFRLRGAKSAKAPKSLERLAPGKQFVDLFAGSGAVTHGAVQRGAAESYLMGEINPRTAGIHQVIKEHPEELAEFLRMHLHGIESPSTEKTNVLVENLYERSRGNEFTGNKIEQAAVDLVLGNYSYRYEPGGEFALGPQKANYIKPENLIRAVEQQSGLLHNVDVIAKPWQETLKHASNESIVFADPPYMKTHGYKFGRFNEIATEELSRALKAHVERGGTVLVDEYPAGMSKFDFLKNVRSTGYGEGKELEGGAGPLFLGAGDKSSPFFSALARNWQSFRSGKGAAQKAFTPEQLAARFKQMGSEKELEAGGFLEVLERLPKGTKLSAEKVDRWLERNNLAGKVRVHELQVLSPQELQRQEALRKTFTERYASSAQDSFEGRSRRYEAESARTIEDYDELIGTLRADLDNLRQKGNFEDVSFPDAVRKLEEDIALGEKLQQELQEFETQVHKLPVYGTSHIAPFIPFKEGDYREEVLGYGSKTLGEILRVRNPEAREAQRTRVDELLDTLYGFGSKSKALTQERDEAIELWHELGDIKETLSVKPQKSQTLNALEEVLQSRLNATKQASGATEALRDLQKPLAYEERGALINELNRLSRINFSREKGLREELRNVGLESAQPFRAQDYHYHKADPFAFGWGRLVSDVIEPETGRGTYALELQSNLAARNAKESPQRVGPFLERGVGPSIDLMLYNAAKRGDDFVAVPVADREFWKHRYGEDAALEKTPEGEWKNYKWLEALYGEKGTIAQQLKARIKSVSGEKVEAERKMLQFSVGRNPKERQHYEGVVIPISEETREAILRKGFKISKLEQLANVARTAFA
jgi:site-specific DNA-adenine methylase